MRRIKNDLTGMIFENLTVVKEVERNKWNQPQYLCNCVCGNHKIVASGNLIYGLVKSCGCLQKLASSMQMGYKFKDISGEKFGKLTAIERSFEYRYSQGTMWKCFCECGKIVFRLQNNLASRKNQSCGCSRKRPQENRHSLLLADK